MLRTIASWILYILGDFVSRVMFYVDSGTLYTIYNKLMTWSVDLDPDGKVWDLVNQDEDSP